VTSTVVNYIKPDEADKIIYLHGDAHVVAEAGVYTPYMDAEFAYIDEVQKHLEWLAIFITKGTPDWRRKRKTHVSPDGEKAAALTPTLMVLQMRPITLWN
jgi:hypothetical protein